MNNEGLMIFIIQAILALFAFFVVAPCVLNAVSLFTVQKRFARTMIDLGVVKEDVVKKLHPKKEIAGVFISLLVVAAFGFGVWKQAPISYLSGGLPLIVGFLKHRPAAGPHQLSSSPPGGAAAPEAALFLRTCWEQQHPDVPFLTRREIPKR